VPYLLHTTAMRSLQDASASWQDLKQYKTLNDLQEAVRLDGGHTSPAASSGLRSACWKTFLLFDSVDTLTWPRTLASPRSAYNSLRMHFLSQLDNQDELSDPMDDEADVCKPDDLDISCQLRSDTPLRRPSVPLGPPSTKMKNFAPRFSKTSTAACPRTSIFANPTPSALFSISS